MQPSTASLHPLLVVLLLSVALAASGRFAPARAAPAAPRGASPPLASATVPVVNVNTATPEQLRLLPGIGPALAERLLRARTRRAFHSLGALRRVRGIGRATLQRLARHVVLAGPTTAAVKLRAPRPGRSHAPRLRRARRPPARPR
ncbi:MAG: helix-hairpin-helix domain-containing protein [Proteobacteria bacterium]|nr:helix-hairpin-helix domain-containing protein [Pseudomonadota bacterium]